MRANRPLVAALIILCVLAGAVPAGAARPDGLGWAPCADDRTARCATLRVPVDWADPYGPRIDIAVARRAATDPARRIGTLVVNPGGPGGSGVDFALGAAGFFSPAVRARFDIVGFDPRGVARSHPVICAESLVESAPSPYLTSRAGYDAAVRHSRRLAADCRRRTGPVYGHVDTLSVVRDTEALRAALGEGRISFYGASYGTLLGAQYAERYPRRVRALVLDSVMDHSVGAAAFLAQGTSTAQGLFDEFVTWCTRDAGCVLRGRDVPGLWASLLARAARGTLADPYDPAHRMTVFDLVQVAFGSFYDPQFDALARFLKEADEGSRVLGRRAGLAMEHSFPAIFCADWDLPVAGYPEFAARLAGLRTRAPQMLVSPLALAALVDCLGRPAPVVNPQAPLAPAVVPTLLINARHDPATGYAWARNVTAQLGPRATLVTYDGWGHVVYGRTPCVTGLVDRYLTELRRPPAGTRCAGVLPDPFGVGRSSPPVVRGRAFE
ncbi:MAG TPA: alpha/beta hydrolase [Actinoplanes sp.]|nr:alpha/beta hydrolase [Actinoplanes sp.]